MNFLQKLQSLPERQKKIIVWGATILLGIGLLAWWIPRMSERLRIQEGSGLGEQFRFQELREQLENIPSKINGEQ
ncbi:MAG: hypothetical protein A3J30_00975 [Candidatus Wildermuthbacteria bacterium RIFCSPLOWO2_02_FULL_47_9c]|uniref:Uncharacterized protein n=2 Tax=Parcubacteria group TaxID=1794811 RepID=A0A837IPN2_9BACT|nr:MAG: hypothetical protein UY25_C0001G0162 [Candidatus Yanofskybacteria bacterium GW2011_GWC1_48_11]KKW03865.1 MAG: hypothetical protein UY38_C0002G0019 [Parcubacteria group bacterium GW2011_GWB1_49_12]KKW08573.1 MAG: hypothetical protein UY45_C0006G0059 [Parcubacteria group bacterium GW2011_GWA1_49_26]KKW14052.1 MAG: hypothetical protein UY53_C0004G0103 [Parcubacteria group bacterium GW2011_GWA2_50_10]OHA65448.1 MAG: hypothetical protein A2674_01500 [Candidatus Wildermuthbacteria bacterium R